jgi:L-ascorbate metabolism protein UlaG (beta-lactamase superfamily)
MPSSNHRIYPYVSDGRYANVPGEQSGSAFWHAFVSLTQAFLRRRPDCSQLRATFGSPQLYRPPQADATQLSWLGHSTFLIEVDGIRILTDPVLFNLMAFPRLMPSLIVPDTLPPIDLVLISHNHRDHMDEATIRYLEQRAQQAGRPAPRFLVPEGDERWFKKRSIATAQEYMWWDKQVYQHDSGAALTMTFLPAWHWSQRGLFDRNRSLWGSWMLTTQSGKKIYFAGDTAYSRHFRAIYEEFGSPDIALMPIGPCEPRSHMRLSHMNAEEAGKACLDLRAKAALPMHFGTYLFGSDNPLAPLHRWNSWWHHQMTGMHDAAPGAPAYMHSPGAIKID